MPRKIQHPKSVTELVINEIKKFIVTNKLQPGDKLPTEKEMAAMFGVGRSSVREATQTLQGLGLVKVVQGRGTFLTDASLTVLKDQLAFTLGCGTTRVSDLTEARRILEVAAVKLAASRATEEQLQEMATIIEEMRYADSQEEILRKGIKFHYAIIRAAQNPLITKMLDAIWGVIYETFTSVIRSQEALEESIANHKQILECIAKGDGEGAGRAMEQHLQALEKRLTEYVASEEQPFAKSLPYAP